MSHFTIRQGRDLRLKGAPDPKVVELSLPVRVAVSPSDFTGLRPRVLVREGDEVSAGTPLLEDKNNPAVRIVSPAGGTVDAVVRGEKRSLRAIVIHTGGRQGPPLEFRKFSPQEIQSLAAETVIEHLLETGLWPCLRRRPFSRVADPGILPKALFVRAVNTEPLAPSTDVILEGREELFQVGLDIVRKLAEGQTHLCYSDSASARALLEARHVRRHTFSGPHPAGNVSTHIHYIDPVRKGETVWYIHARDVLRIASCFLDGVYPSRVTVALTGEGLREPCHVRTVQGASMKDLVRDKTREGRWRFISGSVLNGRDAGEDGFLSFYDSQVTVIPEGGRRRFMGWLSPGRDVYSLSRTFISSFGPLSGKRFVDTDTHGGRRAIVLNHVYDSLVPLDIMTYFLIRAVLAGDIEEAERLGILECDEEDFALCTFACPSKTDVGGIVRQGLNVIEREG